MTDDLNKTHINYGILWFLIGMLLFGVECYTLGLHDTAATLSYSLRMIRFDAIGRFVMLPFWCWFTLHIIIAPKWLVVTPGWRDLIAIALGILLACWETWLK